MQTTADTMASSIISTTLTALETPEVQKLLALICGFTLVKILPKHQKASISFSSWLACAMMPFALGTHPELGHFPATLFMLIAGAVLASTYLISDFSPREEDKQSETDDQQYIKFLEAYNEELDLLLDEQASELEAKDQEISYLESLASLDKQHIEALMKISYIAEAEIEALRAEVQELRDREVNNEHEISRLQLEVSELKELASLDENHIAALLQNSQDDEKYYESQIQDLKNEIQEYRDREEQLHAQLKDSSDLIDAKQHTIEILLDRTKEKDAWKREAEILDKEIEDLYEYTSGEDGVVGLYYRCKEARSTLKVADQEIKRLRSQRNEARESLNSLEKKFQDLKILFETEFVAQSNALAEKVEECERWEERWDEQKDSNAEAIVIVMEKAKEIEGLEEKVVRLREEVEEQQRARSELELAVQGWEQVGTESRSGSGSESESESGCEVVMKFQEERWSDDELYGICLGYNW